MGLVVIPTNEIFPPPPPHCSWRRPWSYVCNDVSSEEPTSYGGKSVNNDENYVWTGKATDANTLWLSQKLSCHPILVLSKSHDVRESLTVQLLQRALSERHLIHLEIVQNASIVSSVEQLVLRATGAVQWPVVFAGGEVVGSETQIMAMYTAGHLETYFLASAGSSEELQKQSPSAGLLNCDSSYDNVALRLRWLNSLLAQSTFEPLKQWLEHMVTWRRYVIFTNESCRLEGHVRDLALQILGADTMTEVDVNSHPTPQVAEEFLVAETGQTLPIVYINGHFVGGLHEMMDQMETERGDHNRLNGGLSLDEDA
eukprot:Filipodium_phascolosomae@DN2167_c0_g1_i1.p1